MSKEISYGEAMSEIEGILEKIETGELDVDQLTVNVKRVAHLLDLCKKKLKVTETEIQKVIDGMEDED
jgi:exodeoxyribonuclease VII small subunit